MPATIALKSVLAPAKHRTGPIAEGVVGETVDGTGLAFEIVSDGDIVSLEQEWRVLEEGRREAILFQSFDWVDNYLTFKKSDSSLSPRIICIRDAGHLIAVLPLCIQPMRGLKVLTGLTEPFQQYTEMLLARDVCPQKLATMLHAALKQTGADYVHFGQVRESGPLAQILALIGTQTADADSAPFVALDAWNNFDDYFSTIKAKTRKNMRNAINRLNRDAPVSHHVAEDEDALRAVIDRSFAGRDAWLERMGLTSRAFRNDDFGAFLKQLPQVQKGGSIELLAMTLCHGDKPVADQWGFVHKGRYYAFMATWDTDYEAASPGKLHLGEVINACYARGIHTADFMIPGSAYKFTWTERAMPVADHLLALTWRGELQTKVWLQWLRPRAKRLLTRLPAGLRGRLLKLVLPAVE